MRTILIILFFFVSTVSAQTATDSTKRTFWSKIFFPSEFGVTVGTSKNLSAGFMARTALEYQLKGRQGFLLRFHYDTRINNYNLPASGVTNVLEGKLRITDLCAGLGYRFGKKKIRGYALLLGGLSMYNFPIVEVKNGTFIQGKDKREVAALSKWVVGAEYWINSTAAITFSMNQSTVWEENDFWNNNKSSFGFTAGFITSFFKQPYAND